VQGNPNRQNDVDDVQSIIRNISNLNWPLLHELMLRFDLEGIAQSLQIVRSKS